jgi:DNA segregation ATPase FtsK/SpoIIIE-like protein
MFEWLKRREPVPAWTGKNTNEIAAHACWNVSDIPGEFLGPSDAFRRSFSYPFPGAYFRDPLTFWFVLPEGLMRGYVCRESGGDIGELAKREYILYEVMVWAEQLYTTDVAPLQETVKAREQARARAQRELEAFAQRFRQTVAADAARVIDVLRDGGQAQLRDWLNEMKPPKALYDQMQKVVQATARDLDKQREAIERQRRDDEWTRQEAVLNAERQVAFEREEARKRLLSAPIPFVGIIAGNVVLGTEVESGDSFAIDVRKLQHSICVGVSGSGKSVLLHLLVHQLVELPAFEQVVLVDLKGGLEFERYSDSSKVRVVWEYDDVVRIVDELMAKATERQTIMRQNRWQLWPHGRIALVIDEFAELQTAIDAAADREEKASARRLMANLLSLSRRARALGIILLCALQKATDDQMPSALRNNLGCRLVLRTANAMTARSMLEIGNEFDDLPRSPTKLKNGRFYYYDASTGDLRYLQAQISPGVELG